MRLMYLYLLVSFISTLFYDFHASMHFYALRGMTQAGLDIPFFKENLREFRISFKKYLHSFMAYIMSLNQ